MVLRIYWLSWITALIFAGALYLSGIVNEVTVPILGFAFSTLVVLGFVAVLPTLLEDHFFQRTDTAAVARNNTFWS